MRSRQLACFFAQLDSMQILRKNPRQCKQTAPKASNVYGWGIHAAHVCGQITAYPDHAQAVFRAAGKSSRLYFSASVGHAWRMLSLLSSRQDAKAHKSW